jgi:hypothetical protein
MLMSPYLVRIPSSTRGGENNVLPSGGKKLNWSPHGVIFYQFKLINTVVIVYQSKLQSINATYFSCLSMQAKKSVYATFLLVP